MKILDKKKWNRREHFNFFSKFDEPFFGLVSEVDVTIAFQFAKEHEISFFAHYLHKSILVINQISEFRYRIRDEDIVVFDEIHPAATIGRYDGTFGFSFIQFNKIFNQFEEDLKREIELVKNSSGLRLNADAFRSDVIHYSSIPWTKFSGLTHARNYKIKDSVPKITFGKTFHQNNKLLMPLSIHVHHGLLDGFHVSKYLELFQRSLNEDD